MGSRNNSKGTKTRSSSTPGKKASKSESIPVKRKHKKHKVQVARTPAEVVKYKKLFVAQLARGKSPGTAARLVGIARGTAYGWKKEDELFDAVWKDAVETGLDEVESRMHARAMKDSASDAQFILKHRRREVYGNIDQPRSTFVLNVTLEEHTKRLERLGLPIPMIESDLEEDDIELKG